MTQQRLPVRVTSLIALIALAAAPAYAQPPHSQAESKRAAQATPVAPDAVNEKKLDAALRAWERGTPSGLKRVIVTATPGNADVVGRRIPAMGGVLKKKLPGVNALVADMPPGLLKKLTLDADVESMSADSDVKAIDGNLVSSNGPSRPAAPLREVMGLSPSKPAAAGIGIAIIDSGIAPSIDFNGRITAFYDFTRGGIATTPIDPYGHGTHIAGIIGSTGASTGSTSGGPSTEAPAQYRGLGPDARLIGLRVLDETGGGETSGVIQAIEFAIAQRDALGIDVINLSLGHPIYEPAISDPLVRTVERAVDAGIVVVASAGNFGYNADFGRSGYAGITSPGNAPSAITVGAMRGVETATRSDDDVAPYSSRGPSWYDGFAKPDLLAPGHGIVSNAPSASTLYTTYPNVRAGTSLMRLNGTSMATAVTTGVVALMLEAHRQMYPQAQGDPRPHGAGAPTLAPNAIKAILQYTSTPLDARAGSPDALTQGAGAINAPAAIASARSIDENTAIGADWFDGPLQGYSVYAGETWAWNASVTWRDTPISGNTLLEFHRPAWTSFVQWGEPIAWDADVLKQPSVVWASSIGWASNVVWGYDLVGTKTGDTTFTWGDVEDPARTVWGDLSTKPTGGQTFCWGDIDTASSTGRSPR